MRIVLLLAIIFIGIRNVSAQDVPQPGRWSIGASFSPDYNVRLPIKYGKEFDLPNKAFTDIETPQIGVSMELSSEYRISQHVALQAGLRYTLRRYKWNSESSALDFYDEFSGTPMPPVNFPTSAELKERHHFVGVPIRANFTFGKNRLRYGLGIGCTANVLIWSTKKARYGYLDGSTQNKTIQNQTSFKRFTLTPELAAGISYTLSSKSYFKVEPTVRALIPMGYMWGFGLNLSYYKSF